MKRNVRRDLTATSPPDVTRGKSIPKDRLQQVYYFETKEQCDKAHTGMPCITGSRFAKKTAKREYIYIYVYIYIYIYMRIAYLRAEIG